MREMHGGGGKELKKAISEKPVLIKSERVVTANGTKEETEALGRYDKACRELLDPGFVQRVIDVYKSPWATWRPWVTPEVQNAVTFTGGTGESIAKEDPTIRALGKVVRWWEGGFDNHVRDISFSFFLGTGQPTEHDEDSPGIRSTVSIRLYTDERDPKPSELKPDDVRGYTISLKLDPRVFPGPVPQPKKMDCFLIQKEGGFGVLGVQRDYVIRYFSPHPGDSRRTVEVISGLDDSCKIKGATDDEGRFVYQLNVSNALWGGGLKPSVPHVQNLNIRQLESGLPVDDFDVNLARVAMTAVESLLDKQREGQKTNNGI